MLNAASSPHEYPVAKVHVKKIAAGVDVEHVGVLLVNDATLDIKPHATAVAGGADCTPPERLENVFAIWPHMHLLGKHVSVATSEKSLIDKEWNFDKQDLHPMSEVVETSNKLSVRCTYDNPTDREVKFGMGTKDEMCAAFVYYYPATQGGMCAR